MSANPREYDELSLIKECNNIADKIKTAKQDNQFDFRQRHEVSINMIQEFISDQTPQVVHFSGHGNKGFLLLEDENGLAEKANKKAFVNMFGTLNGRTSIHERDKIRCVVLSACYSRGIAKAVARYVDCVVGMSNEIGDDAARVFAEAFYYHLCSGESINDAVKLGRNKVELLHIPGQDIPKLESRDGVDPSKIFLTNIVEMSPQNAPQVGDPIKMVEILIEKHTQFSISTRSTVDEFWAPDTSGGLGKVLLYFSTNANDLGVDNTDKNYIDEILTTVPPKLKYLDQATKLQKGTLSERQQLESDIRKHYSFAVEILSKIIARKR